MLRPRRALLLSVAVFCGLVALAFFVLQDWWARDTGLKQPRTYAFEAHIDVAQSEDFGNDQPLDSIASWYRAPNRWRWEIFDSKRLEAGSVQVADGNTVWFYDRETNTYWRQSYDDYYRHVPPRMAQGPFLPAAFGIGPIPSEARQLMLDAWQIKDATTSAGEEIAGRPTQRVSSTQDDATSAFWFDREYAFVLKFLAENPLQPQSRITAEITSLTLDEPVDESKLRFEPPPGSREVPPPANEGVSSGSGSIGGSGVHAPAGFFSPDYLPHGYESTGSGETLNAANTVVHVFTRFQHADQSIEPEGDYLLIEQQFRAGGLAPSQRAGDPATVGQAQGYSQTSGDELRLVWEQGDVVITLSTNALPLDQLLRVGQSMQR